MFRNFMTYGRATGVRLISQQCHLQPARYFHPKLIENKNLVISLDNFVRGKSKSVRKSWAANNSIKRPSCKYGLVCRLRQFLLRFWGFDWV